MFGYHDLWWSWSYSEATYEHKAFTYWAPASLLAVPLSTHRYIYDQVEMDGKVYSYSGYQYVSMLKMIDVDTDNGTLTAMARLSILISTTKRACLAGGRVQPASEDPVFMGDFVYSFSSGGATVHRTEDLSLMVELDLTWKQTLCTTILR